MVYIFSGIINRIRYLEGLIGDILMTVGGGGEFRVFPILVPVLNIPIGYWELF